MLIIGAGPAGLYAAYYAGFRGWSVVVMDALPEPGGQITAMYPEKEIFDVAGYPAIKGRVLVESLVKAAGTFSPTYVLGEQAVELARADDGRAIVSGSEGSSITAKAVIITGGIGSFTPRALPADHGFEGKGLVYFVPHLADHADKDVVIVGGGDSAFDWAYALQPIARSVSLVHRREQFRAHSAMVDTVREMGVRLYTSSEVSEIRGDDWVREVVVTHRETGQTTVLPAQTVVASLGFVANIGPIASWGLELDKRHLVVDTAMRTNLPGIFGAGDIVSYEGKVPLISVGFGEAALAVNNAAPIIEPGMGIFPGHSSGGGQ